MSGRIEYRLDQATSAEILGHLKSCESAFNPPLGTRVDLEAYAKKIGAKAKRFEAWADGVLIGLVAAYCNDPLGRDAYITSVSVLEAWRGEGIAGRLLDQCAGSARAAGFRRLRLEVGTRNSAAIQLYEKFGFAIEDEGPELARMCLQL